MNSLGRVATFLLLAFPLLAQVPSVQEHPCKGTIPNARCGFIEVAEDSAKPAGRKIHIEFVRVRSTAKDRDPDAWIDIAGGPGVASTPDPGFMLQVFGYVLKRRDLVFYDQRGTGASSGLHCDLHDGVKPENAGDFIPEDGVQQCWQKVSPTAELSKYNTTASVQDLDQLREGLGYNKLVLHALSYGTRLAQAYLQAHPEHVRALVLEGALQPGARIPVGFARGTQKTLEAVLDDCRHEPACKPIAEEIDLKKIAAMKELTFTSGERTVHMTSAQFFEMLRTMLYDAEASRRVPLLLSQVSRGDTHQLGILYHLAYRDNPAFSWPLWLSVTCAEDTPFIREDEIGPDTQGTLPGAYRIRQQQQACKFWPVPKRDPALGKPTDVPVLLMEGAVDLVTPPWPEQKFHHYFPQGTQLVLPHTGHMPIGLDGIECLDNIEEQFLTSPGNKPLDTTCVAEIRRKPFVVEEKK